MLQYLKDPKVILGLVLMSLTGCAGVAALVDPQTTSDIANSLFQNQMTQMTAAFAAAAFIHKGQVKKELSAQFAVQQQMFISLLAPVQKTSENNTKRIEKIESSIQNTVT